jgi:gluconolactonase
MESPFDVRDSDFHRLIPEGTTIERIAAGLTFTEGPVWIGDSLLFSDIPNNRIARWRELPEGPQLTTHICPSGWPLGVPTKVAQHGSNGLTLDRQGRLLACEHGNRRVSRHEPDGSVVALATHFQGKRLNSPNDIVCKSDGCIYFSDPPYGLFDRTEGKELDWNGVYRIDPDGSIHLLVDDFGRPNGLAFSPDESLLYIDDTEHRLIRVFDVRPDGSLANGRLFIDMAHPDAGNPDGMKVDVEGNVYCTGPGGIWVIAPSGTLLGRIHTPDLPANCAWGGDDWRTLFITARPCVYRLRVAVPGIPVG